MDASTHFFTTANENDHRKFQMVYFEKDFSEHTATFGYTRTHGSTLTIFMIFPHIQI